jgi:hypothetical protein
MSSKSKDVRIEQRRILEKKLDLRLQKLTEKGISQKKAQSDPLVKNLKAKIRETNVRIAAFDKFVRRAEELAQVKAQKSAQPVEKEAEAQPETAPVEAKPKKKTAAATGEEPKKKAAAPKEPKKKPADAEAPKKLRKKKEEPQEG